MLKDVPYKGISGRGIELGTSLNTAIAEVHNYTLYCVIDGIYYHVSDVWSVVVLRLKSGRYVLKNINNLAVSQRPFIFSSSVISFEFHYATLFINILTYIVSPAYLHPYFCRATSLSKEMTSCLRWPLSIDFGYRQRGFKYKCVRV